MKRPRWFVWIPIFIVAVGLIIAAYFLGMAGQQADISEDEDIVPVSTVPEKDTDRRVVLENIKEESASARVEEVDRYADLQGKISFDPLTIIPGDLIGSMTVVRTSFDDRFDPRRIVGIQFSGTVRVTGEYQKFDEEDAFVSGEVCMGSLDGASLDKMPQASGDGRRLWFCFTNTEVADQLLSGEDGTATVFIDDYTIALQETVALNSATLVSVVSQ